MSDTKVEKQVVVKKGELVYLLFGFFLLPCSYMMNTSSLTSGNGNKDLIYSVLFSIIMSLFLVEFICAFKKFWKQ